MRPGCVRCKPYYSRIQSDWIIISCASPLDTELFLSLQEIPASVYTISEFDKERFKQVFNFKYLPFFIKVNKEHNILYADDELH